MHQAYLNRGKKALLMLAVKLRANTIESDLPSLAHKHMHGQSYTLLVSTQQVITNEALC
jgi:hypothetical protein